MADLEEPTRGAQPQMENVDAAVVTDLANSADLFYWMEECDADIPLPALGLDFPMGCRFCV